MPTLRYVDVERTGERGEPEAEDQAPPQRRPPVDTNHITGTTAATSTEANQASRKRRSLDANHGPGPAAIAAAAASRDTDTASISAAANADADQKLKRGQKRREQSVRKEDGKDNKAASALNPSSSLSTTTSSVVPAKGGRSVRRPVAPTKKIRRSCSMPNCIKPSQGPRHNHLCKIHMSGDSAVAAPASTASPHKGAGASDRTHRPPRQQKTAPAFKPSRGPALGSDQDADDQKMPPAPPPALPSSKATTGKSPMNFLFKLYEMLEDASSGNSDRDRQVPGAPNGEKLKLSEVVSFTPSGLAYKVFNEPVFRSHVLPLYFGKATYLTYKRVLNHYGFVRLTKGADRGCYYHRLFRQNHKHLVHLIKPGKPIGSDSCSSARAAVPTNSESTMEERAKFAFRRVGHLPTPKVNVGIEDASRTGKKGGAQALPDEDDTEDYCEV